jgi:hypothetical protein
MKAVPVIICFEVHSEVSYRHSRDEGVILIFVVKTAIFLSGGVFDCRDPYPLAAVVKFHQAIKNGFRFASHKYACTETAVEAVVPVINIEIR